MPTILYAITDRKRLGIDEAGLVQRIAWLARAGVDLIQIRERDLADGPLAALVREAVGVTRDTRARILVNARADVAVAAAAHGVHLRGDSFPASRVRAWAPSGFVIGRSVHAIDEARAAERDDGCDFLLFGTIFASRGKPAHHPTAGIAGLADICRGISMPVVAIGGIDTGRVADMASAGAAGVAAVDLFFGAADEGDARARVAVVRRAFDSGSRQRLQLAPK